ncbi:MAG: phosphoenolpyruvate carboxykinase (GTP) [Alphaproteobacteria bacterium]
MESLINNQNHTNNSKVISWINEIVDLCKPRDVVWYDGSETMFNSLCQSMVAKGTYIKLNQAKRPNSYVCRTHPEDTKIHNEHTYLCTAKEIDAGPTNNWAPPRELRENISNLFNGCMAGRTLYVVPFSLGALDSSDSLVGIEITDSPYVVTHLHILTSTGQSVLDALGSYGDFIHCVHSVGCPLKENQKDVSWPCNLESICIASFPETQEIWSFGSGYGENAILSRYAAGLKMASYIGLNQGWFPLHMSLLAVEDDKGEKSCIAFASPDNGGKTSMATLNIPEKFSGYKIYTIGDDVAWIRPNDDGYFYATNPEKGFFGILSNTSLKNKNIIETIKKSTIFTNVAITDDGDIWWEGLDTPPHHLVDWQGHDWIPENRKIATHQSARYASPLSNCPSFSYELYADKKLPISAFVFSSRGSSSTPLIFQSFNWSHGVYLAATMETENCSDLNAKCDTYIKDPMGMLTFCGSNMGDYFALWLKAGYNISAPPPVFRMNFFRRDQNGNLIWVNGENNFSLLKWIIDRAKGKNCAIESPFGMVPRYQDINWANQEINRERFDSLFTVDAKKTRQYVIEHKEFLRPFADLQRLPREFMHELGLFSLRIERLKKDWTQPK